MVSEEIATTYQGKHRTYSFRFSIIDFFVLVITMVSSVYLWQYTVEMSILILFVVGHFFLFCNIFRVRRGPELIWTGFFLANSTFWLVLLEENIIGLLVTTLIFTIIIIANELCLPCYHGIFAKNINKSLDLYLTGKC